MLNEKEILRRIEIIEVMAINLQNEATQLRKSLGVVSTTPTGPQGKRAELIAQGINKRNKTIAQRVKK